jgi:succinyl-diaminopimelate desuccinylase
VDVRYLPNQDPEEILGAIRELPDAEITKVFHRAPAIVERSNPFVRALGQAVAAVAPRKEGISVGRHGASDAICFLDAGVPAVEFGPVGDGHHGPEEWVSIESLALYRKALVEYVEHLPERLRDDGETRLRVAG